MSAGNVALIILGLLLAGAAASITIVPQSHVYLIERMSVYHRALPAGLHFKIPGIERAAHKISRMEQMADFTPWPIITNNNVSIQVDAVVFYEIEKPMLFAYAVERPLLGIENLTRSILRNVIGAMPFEDVLAARDTISEKMRNALDEATDPWGIKVNRVELQEISPPPELQEDMVKNLRAKIEKEEKIAQAQAKAEAIRLINDAAPGSEYLQLQAMEAFAKAADGKATKIVIPSDMQGLAGLAGLAGGMAEAMKGDSNS
ncbi:MAG: paraslipin [Oscillospiraceae bacterium]|nr:paraslipin [Oscillospiraceae bacterium]